MQTVKISAEYDSEAGVWVAESDNPPFVTEADTVEALRAKLPGMIFDLIDWNEDAVVIELTAHSSESITAPRAA